MHIPPVFRETDPAFLRAFLQDNGFATLVSCDRGTPVATHLLLVARDSGGSELRLRGHMSRENPQWRSFDQKDEVLAIFNGPHAYVSAGWYSVHSAPTWNYISVHAYGRPRLIEDRGEVFTLLERLVDSQEVKFAVEARYRIESLPVEVRESMMNGVAAFEIAVTRVEAAAKLSQNRSARDYQAIIDKLSASQSPNSVEIAKEMERRKAQNASRPIAGQVPDG